MSSVTTAQDTWDTLLCEVDEYGDRYWFDENGKFHRENGPAIVNIDGSVVWFKHGEYHRIDGPAYIRHNGYVEYWIEGEYLTEEEFNARKLTING